MNNAPGFLPCRVDLPFLLPLACPRTSFFRNVRKDMKKRDTHRILFFLLLSAVLSMLGSAQASRQQLGRVTYVRALPNGVELTAVRARIRVVALSDAVIRVQMAPGGVFPVEHSWAVLPDAFPAGMRVKVVNSASTVVFATAHLKVRVEKSPLRIVFLDAADRVLLEDAPRRPVEWGTEGFRVWKTMPEDEHYFGLGEKAGGPDRRNQSYTMWNTDAFGWQESTDPLYKSIPFFLAMRRGRAWGLFLDNTWRTNFDFGKESRDTFSFGADGGALDYYFFYGPHPKKVIEDFTGLVGRTPLPPLWALGYQQCRYSYFPEARVREVARTFREKQIPADVLYLDIDYQDGNRPFTVDRKLFPNFEGMIRDLDEQGFRVIAITDLHLKKEQGYAPYDQGHAGDHFVRNPDVSEYVGVVWPGESVFPEFTLARSRQWWGTLYREFVGMGISGFWNDMNEPAIFQRADKTMPLGTRHRMDDGSVLDHRAVHNVFGMLNARATYEGLLQLQPEKRPFVLTRAAYAGAWRYAASWTGDNTSSWNHLRLTVPTLLGLGLSGYSLVGNDVGGFAGSPTPELLTRWIQLGVFTPIFRNHTVKGSADQEPWVHGPEHEAIRRRAIELRYRLLPYIYSYAEESARTGLPLMRPLFLEYPEEERFAAESDPFRNEFLFGGDLLVAPDVLEDPGAYEVRLPAGVWYDYWTGERIPGGEKIKLTPALDTVPIFVRAGAIVPQQPVVQSTAQVPQGPLELRVYPGPDCRGSLYQDDGTTFAYRQGEFLRLQFTCQADLDSLQLALSLPEGTFAPWWESVQVEVYGVQRRPQEVFRKGVPTEAWRWDEKTHQLLVTIPGTGLGENLTVRY